MPPNITVNVLQTCAIAALVAADTSNKANLVITVQKSDLMSMLTYEWLGFGNAITNHRDAVMVQTIMCPNLNEMLNKLIHNRYLLFC